MCLLFVIKFLFPTKRWRFKRSEYDLWKTVEWGWKWLGNFNAGKTHLVSFYWSNSSGTIDVKLNGSDFTEKSSINMLELPLSSKLDWIAKTVSKTFGALSRSVKFLPHKVPLYVYKSVIQPCMDYCCHIWTGAVSCIWLC